MHSLFRAGLLSMTLSSALGAQTVAEQHVELKATIEQWMDEMEKSQELESRWATERVNLADSIAGLKSMVTQTESDIAAVQARLDEAGEASQEKLAEQEKFNAAREALRKGLSPVEAEVIKVAPLFPEFYVGGDEGSAKLKAAIEQLREHVTAEPDEKEKLGLNSRLQPVVQILTEAERFHEKLWAVSHPLTVGEVEKQMKVLYFGLSLAYAVDDEGTVAMAGHSSPEGWVFERMSGEGIATQVLTLYTAADGSGESQMVSLPLDIK